MEQIIYPNLPGPETHLGTLFYNAGCGWNLSDDIYLVRGGSLSGRRGGTTEAVLLYPGGLSYRNPSLNKTPFGPLRKMPRTVLWATPRDRSGALPHKLSATGPLTQGARFRDTSDLFSTSEVCSQPLWRVIYTCQPGLPFFGKE